MSLPSEEQLIQILGTLLAVIVGGLLTSMTTFVIERQKWKRERRNKLDELRRDAVAAALEWISPMRTAEYAASSLVMAAIQGDFEHERFMVDYPNLVLELAKSDLTGVQRASLPSDFYARGHEIIRDLEKLRILGVKCGQEVKIGRSDPNGYKECMETMSRVSKSIEELESELKRVFLDTLE